MSINTTMNAHRRIVLDGTLGHWRDHVRALIGDGVAPEEVTFVDARRPQSNASSGAGGSTDRAAEANGHPGSDHGGLFGAHVPEEVTPSPPQAAPLALPTPFVRRLTTVACHRSSDIWRVCYDLCWRMAMGERDPLEDPLDPLVVAFERMEKSVRRDAHKMHAFVRFRRVEDTGARNAERFIAWYDPSHPIVRREANYFRKRFPSKDWSILTPDGCSHWDGSELSFTAGVDRSKAPEGDELEELWCTYYASIYNPARLKLKAITPEMPRVFWHTLPETA